MKVNDNERKRKEKFFRSEIPAIYRSDFLEAHLHGFVTACIMQGKSMEEAIKTFQGYWSLEEENLCVATCRMIYYRKQKQFKERGGTEIGLVKTADQLLIEEMEKLQSSIDRLSKKIKV